MAHYHPVEATPVLAVQDGYVVCAAVVLGHVSSFGNVRLHVRTWEAGRGERDDYLAPADFEDWRRSFVKPTHES